MLLIPPNAGFVAMLTNLISVDAPGHRPGSVEANRAFACVRWVALINPLLLYVAIACRRGFFQALINPLQGISTRMLMVPIKAAVPRADLVDIEADRSSGYY